jgi:hypothetical protein
MAVDVGRVPLTNLEGTSGVVRPEVGNMPAHSNGPCASSSRCIARASPGGPAAHALLARTVASTDPSAQAAGHLGAGPGAPLTKPRAATAPPAMSDAPLRVVQPWGLEHAHEAPGGWPAQRSQHCSAESAAGERGGGRRRVIPQQPGRQYAQKDAQRGKRGQTWPACSKQRGSSSKRGCGWRLTAPDGGLH